MIERSKMKNKKCSKGPSIYHRSKRDPNGESSFTPKKSKRFDVLDLDIWGDFRAKKRQNFKPVSFRV